MLCLVRVLPTLGGHRDWQSLAPPPGGLRRPGDGQEVIHQGHLEGQPGAPSEELVP
jgi:hypothetical protein